VRIVSEELVKSVNLKFEPLNRYILQEVVILIVVF
jgi:hypothetical protein